MEIPSISPSVNPLVIKKIITEGYIDEMKRINLFFYYQRIYRRTKHYRRKIHRRSISVGDSVGKLIFDGICVLR
jgi:plasmid replication initiation protein